jgi:hypothetical protein
MRNITSRKNRCDMIAVVVRALDGTIYKGVHYKTGDGFLMSPEDVAEAVIAKQVYCLLAKRDDFIETRACQQ